MINEFPPQRVPWKSFRLLHWRRINGASARREARCFTAPLCERNANKLIYVCSVPRTSTRRRHTHTHAHANSRFCAALEKASSPSCEDKSLWWNESGDTVQFSRWVTPLFTVRHNVLHQCIKNFFFCFRFTVCGLWRRQNHPSGTALSGVCSFFH